MISPAPLFLSLKERIAVLGILLLLFGITLFKEYLEYKEFLEQKIIVAQVILQYKKGKKWVLKVQTQNRKQFYTTSYEDLKPLRSRWVKLKIFKLKKPPSFLSYLKNSFYLPSYLLALLPQQERVLNFISSQHQDPFFKQLFGALFTAFPMQERKYISLWGVNHLVAISGFHLSLISSLVSFLIIFTLKPLWEKYFPYLNLYLLGVGAALIAVFGYTLFLGEVPSVVRSLVMLVIGVVLYVRHIKLLSFETLFWVVLIILALFPSFLFALGFWFSVTGVFLIYLFLTHFSHLKKVTQFLLIHLFLFFTMLPFSLYFFKQFSFFMLFSPLLTIAFYIFYPLEAFLHLIGYGGVLDQYLEFLKVEGFFKLVEIETWELLLYLLGLFGSIFSRRVLYITLFALGVDLIHKIT